jgi:hypothetical protein
VNVDRCFRLQETIGSGVHCSEKGLFVGRTPLLERAHLEGRRGAWRPRPVFEIQHDLGETYGIPIDLTAKHGGIVNVARALSNQETAQAQVSALLLQFPDPPPVPIVESDIAQLVDLAKALQASNLLSRDWDPDKHPRWPARSPDRTGGQFAPRGSANSLESEPATVHARSRERSTTSATRSDGSESGVSFAATIGVLTHQIYQPGGWTACVYSNGVLLMFPGRVTCPAAAIGAGG